jgi:hypothetical protein
MWDFEWRDLNEEMICCVKAGIHQINTISSGWNKKEVECYYRNRELYWVLYTTTILARIYNFDSCKKVKLCESLGDLQFCPVKIVNLLIN